MSDEINLMIDLIVTAGFNVTQDAGGFVLTKERSTKRGMLRR